MTERKVIKMGDSSLVVSLPKRWVEKAKITKGIPVEVEELSTGELIIKPKTGKIEKKTSEIDPTIGYISEIIINNYINGADVFVIASQDSLGSEVIDAVYKTIYNLPGVEITEASSRKMVIEYYGAAMPPKRLLSRFSLILTNYLQGTAAAFKENSGAEIETLKKIQETDKLYYSLLRNLVRAASDVKTAAEMELKTHEPVYYASIARNFKEIAEEMEKIEYYDTKNSEKISYFFERALKVHKKSMKAWGNKDTLAALEANSEVNDILREISMERKRLEGEVVKVKKGILMYKDEVQSRIDKVKGALTISEPEYFRNILNSLQIILRHIKWNTEFIALDCAYKP